jgi:hypothetical protein
VLTAIDPHTGSRFDESGFMDSAADVRVKPPAPETRLGLLILAAQLVVIGFPLVVLSEQTDTYFSWSIQPPLTAAFLGACYWGSCLLVLLSAQRSAWAHARVVLPGIVVAGCLLLLATLLHLDRFHMDAVTGWVWLVLYALLPPAALLLFLRQRAVPGGDPPRRTPMPRWAVLALTAQAVLLLTAGAALFVVPEDAAALWPWTLTPLTGRAIGAWLMAIGASAAHAAWEADWERIRAGMLGYATIAVLELIAIVRFADTPDWDDPSACVLLLGAMLATGVFAAAFARAPSAPPPAERLAGLEP